MTASDVDKSTSAQSSSPQSKTEGTSPAKSDSTMNRHKEAMNHFVAGKRHLLVRDFSAAVTSFALACELLSAEFGETAYECADAYYYYGKALLELARAESGVFGNALDGVPDGEDSDNSQVEDPDKMTEEERDEVEKKVGEALDENFQVLEEKKQNRAIRAGSTEDETEEEESEDKDVEKEKEATEETGNEEKKDEEKEATEETGNEEKKDEEKEATEETGNEEKKDEEESKEEEAKEEEAKDEESVGGAEAEEKEGEDMKEQEAEDEEDPSNLQLAWEMLELAKVAYNHQLEKVEDKKAVEMKICETLLVLGEVSLESETYEQAVADITECLNKRKALHPADSRRIAETYYQLGVALGHHNKFDEAIKALEDAIACLKLRMENLKNKAESADESKADDAFYTREAEVSELENLIPEIRDKIQDTKDMKEQSEQNKAEESTGFAAAKGDGKEGKPISTISVKRKADGETSSPKKAHVENGAK